MTRLRLAVLILISVSTAALATAQADPDPPSRVARLNYVAGEVSFQPGGVEDWTAADLNRPLTTADRLWTDREARAELHIGSAALRLGPETSFTLANLDDHSVQIQLAQGTLNLRVRSLAEDDAFEIDTPNLSFILLHPGDYRVEVDSEGRGSMVTVRSGSGEAAGAGQRLTLRANQQVRFSDDENAAEINDAPARDEFDAWCVARNRREDEVRSARYVSPEVTGYEDLDTHGDWHQEAGYGPVWMPRAVAVDWAPYRYGHWAWVFPWGWTWIDDSPWGFAPFHYGRWVHLRHGWAWVPGPRVARPVYAPALVAWVGGSSWAIGVSVGRPVGWFPLGPREVYVPAYRSSRTYVTNVNITNTNVTVVNINETRVTRVFVNQHVRGAVTAVPEDAFINSHPVHRAVLNVRENDLRRVKVVTTVSVAPARRSLLGREDAPGHRPPERVLVRPVVARKAPPHPVPFDAQRRSVGDDGTIRPVHTRDFPEMRRPTTISPERPGPPANGNRGRGPVLPQHRAEADRAEPPSDRGRSRDGAEQPVARPNVPRPDRDEARPRRERNEAEPPVTRPGVNVPRPDRDEARPRRERDEVARPPEERGRSANPDPPSRRVAPRPEENAGRRPAPAREEARPPQGRDPEQSQPSSPRAVERPVPPRSDSRPSEPVARETGRPQNRPTPRAEEPQPRQPRAESARPAANGEREGARPAREKKEKAAPSKPDDKGKEKGEKGDRS